MAEKQEKRKINKKALIGVAALAAVVAVLAVVFIVFREKPVQGHKSITIEVIDNTQDSTVYEVHTDAEYLRQAMEEAEGLEFSGTESEYGLMVETVNGVTPDYSVDGAYWSFYVNGAYCNYGVDSQPVEDGDAFVIKYEVYAAE
ncbi:MAG: DUF4430 domain-containing protein [Lachnospiraceae bacterium]|nr:DUF4430 domain-containing protein [Lachnospiraceae bacterium]